MPEPGEAAPVAPPEDPPPEATKKSNTGVIVAIVAIIAVAAGVGIFLRLRHSPPAEKAKTQHSAPKKKEVKAVLHMDSFVVNLGGAEEKAYLRVGVDLGLAGEGKDKKADVGLETALVRDTLLTTLASAKPDDLLTAEGKAKLKADLLRALQQRAPDMGVEEIYFNEFLIQR